MTSKKSPNVYKSCPKMISLIKRKIFITLQKLPKNVGDLGKILVATAHEKLLKVQKIAQYGHTGSSLLRVFEPTDLFSPRRSRCQIFLILNLLSENLLFLSTFCLVIVWLKCSWILVNFFVKCR